MEIPEPYDLIEKTLQIKDTPPVTIRLNYDERIITPVHRIECENTKRIIYFYDEYDTLLDTINLTTHPIEHLEIHATLDKESLLY